MLTLTEWLNQVGFLGGHPFALKQADEEGELLQEYFVEHEAYNQILDTDRPRSTILHAPRGAGKSTTRRMFERHCRERTAQFQPLIVWLIDWMPVLERAGSFTVLRPHDYLHEILCQTVLALSEEAAAHAPQPPRDAELAGYLNWLCLTYDNYLTRGQRRVLRERGWVPEQNRALLTGYELDQLPLMRAMRLLVEILGGLGYDTCYVLVDGVDEVLETTASWEAGANMIAPLFGNLHIVEVPGLAFKCFLPSEIVAILRQRGVLREDRIKCYSMTWDLPLLLALLHARLEVFSNGSVPRLAALAPEIRDIDEQVCDAAAGSPRQLLNLCDWLFQNCAAEADNDHLLIQPHHLARVIAKLDRRPTLGQIAVPVTSAIDYSVPPLQIRADGSVWRGSRPIEGSQKLPPLQRRFLQYLYMHRGKLCEKEALIDYVWKDRHLPEDDSLRKLAERAIQFVESDPKHPVYIQKVFGGGYRLDNASDEPL